MNKPVFTIINNLHELMAADGTSSAAHDKLTPFLNRFAWAAVYRTDEGSTVYSTTGGIDGVTIEIYGDVADVFGREIEVSYMEGGEYHVIPTWEFAERRKSA